MATYPSTSTNAAGTDRGEARFFLIMAAVMSATIIGGFSFNLMAGRSTFSVPWLVHAHAVVMLAWIALYLAQNLLVFTNNIALHRRLGWLSLVMIPLVTIMGVMITTWTLRARGGPPFFGQNEFLFANSALLLTFVGLSAWALAWRKNTAWHRRLLFCAFALLTGPGVGRLVPAIYLIPFAWYLTTILPSALFPAIGMAADKRRYGAVHPAWLWGLGIMLVLQFGAELLAASEWGVSYTQQFVAGTPGADRPMEAFFPTSPPG